MNQDDRSRESRNCDIWFPDSILPKATRFKQQIRDTMKLQDLYDVQVQVDFSRFNMCLDCHWQIFPHAHC